VSGCLNEPQRRSFPVPRASIPRLAVAIVSVCLAGAFAVLGLTLVTISAAFVASLLMLDRAVPSTGVPRHDAEHSFQRQVWQRRRSALGLPSHRSGRLELLSDQLLSTARRSDLGTHTIPLRSITGTVEADKAASFDAAFRPPFRSRRRWELMWADASRGDSFPPISVFRVGEEHFVIDGHHRVSVSRALGAQNIDATVVELRPLKRRRRSTNPGRTRAGPEPDPGVSAGDDA
jgi:hypothetical protein